MDFYATEINIFLIGKNMLIVMVPILIDKDVFKPSYNDLKFMVKKKKIHGPKLQLVFHQWVTNIMTHTLEVLYIVGA